METRRNREEKKIIIIFSYYRGRNRVREPPLESGLNFERKFTPGHREITNPNGVHRT